MFYVPWGLRKPEEPFSPKGPNFKRARRTRFYVDDSEIIISAPKHRAPAYYEPRNPKGQYSLQEMRLSNSSPQRPEWKGLSVMRKAWDFYGPSFIGGCGNIRMNAVIVSPENMVEGTSFYNPRVFEAGVASRLTYNYFFGDDVKEQRQEWFAPVNWKPLPHFPCVAVSFDVTPNKIWRSEHSIRCLYFPVSDSHLMEVSFKIFRGTVFKTPSTPDLDTNEWVDIEPFLALSDQVRDSVTFTMSDQAKAQQKKALDGLEDSSLVKTFAPLKWLDGGMPSEPNQFSLTNT